MKRLLAGIHSRIVDVRPIEVRALWLGFAFHFLILTGYYIMRPIRDSIAAGNRLETLPWMFAATLVAMVIANALFAAIVARMSRRKFIPLAYAFFIFNLALFFVLMRTGSPEQQVWIGRALYVWVSVFNLFNTAIFWAFMTDLFTVEQGKRLYGFIAVGGSLGGIVGPLITARYVRDLGPANLLVISAIMFAIAGALVRFFPNNFTEGNKAVRTGGEEPIGGSIFSGVTHIVRSPYLIGLAASMLLYTTTSTWAYFQQSDLTRSALTDSGARTVFLAHLDMWVNSITVLIQIFLTGRLLKWFGVGFTLVALPFISMIGFATMGVATSLAVLAVFQVARRVAAYALMRPSREILFTVLRREDKYKVKSVTDTLGYRTGDQLGAWSYTGLHSLGLDISKISFVAVPVLAGWCVLSLWLGKRQVALARAGRTGSE
ncbi:MAG: antiporter, family [Verrucomicrobiota bacterium]|jgi:AAA family ATP:ADP antiporter